MATFTNANFTGDIALTDASNTLTLDADLAYSGVLSGTGSLTIVSDDPANNAWTLTMSGVNTFTGNLTINPMITLSVSAATAFGAVPTAGTAVADKIGLAGGTINLTGSTDVSLSEEFGVTLTAASTISVNINDGSRGGSLTVNGAIAGDHNLTVNGGDNVNYLPSLILTHANSSDSVVTIAEGLSFELVDDGTWAGDVALSGDLKGNGTVSGNVTSTGGRLSPGSTVGSSMTISGNLVMDEASSMYFGMDSETIIDALTVGGTATLDGTATMVPYVEGSTLPAGAQTFNLIEVTGTITDNTLALEVFPGYSDGNDDPDAPTTYSRTMTGAVSGQNYVLTIAA